MQRRLVQSLLVCIALAVAFVVPLRARAAILPACENRELITLAPALPLADPLAEPVVNAACATLGSELEGARGAAGDSNVAPICDPRGASMVAPPRIHPVNDDRIEAPPDCEVQSTSPMLLPSSRDSSAIHFGAVLAAHAILGGDTVVPRVLSELAPAYLPTRGEDRAGIQRDVYHPPR
jgi:hypothetical protein